MVERDALWRRNDKERTGTFEMVLDEDEGLSGYLVFLKKTGVRVSLFTRRPVKTCTDPQWCDRTD